MTGTEEHADGTRGLSAYPSEWGLPKGKPLSEERTAWVRSKVREHAGAQAHRKIAARDARLLLSCVGCRSRPARRDPSDDVRRRREIRLRGGGCRATSRRG